MKKIGLAVAVAAAMGATSIGVQAYTLGTFGGVGQLAPFVYWNNVPTAVDTWVGLVARCAGTIHWTYFDQDSKHVVDDYEKVTKNDLTSWNVSNKAPGYAGITGYATFLFDKENPAAIPFVPGAGDNVLTTNDEKCLAASAFLVDAANNDVAWLPTLPLALADINPNWAADLTVPAPNYNAVIGLLAGAPDKDVIYLRYFVDNILGNADTTKIKIWTVCKPPGSQSLRWYNDNQDSVSANYPTPNDEVNEFDPEATLIAATAGAFKDGFIPWVVKAAANPNGALPAGAGDNLRYCDNHGYNGAALETQAAVSMSQMYSSLFGAHQTILNSHVTP